MRADELRECCYTAYGKFHDVNCPDRDIRAEEEWKKQLMARPTITFEEATDLMEPPIDERQVQRLEWALGEIRRKYNMPVQKTPATDIQQVEITITGPRVWPKSALTAFGNAPVPRSVFEARMEVPHTPPEYLREKVLSFLADLDGDDQHYLQLDKDQADEELAGEYLERAQAALEQLGWHPPEQHEEPPPPHWATTEQRTERQRDPTQHTFLPLTVPGLTNRCASCGTAARNHHTAEEAEAQA